MRHISTIMTASILSLSLGSIAKADSITGILSIGLTVQSSCSINSTSNAPLTLTFETAGSLVNGVTANTPAVLNVTCSAGTHYMISMDGGQNASNSTRRLKCSTCGSTPQYVPYLLSRSVGGSDLWTIDTAYTPTADGSGAAQAFQINATILPTTAAAAVGSYTDNVTVTVTY